MGKKRGLDFSIAKRRKSIYYWIFFLGGLTGPSARRRTSRRGHCFRPKSSPSFKARFRRLRPPEPRAHRMAPGRDIAAAQKIEADLQDPARLVLRAMQVRYPIQPDSANFEADAAFLLRARDVLNARAAPATGATIAFTAMVAAHGARTRRWWQVGRDSEGEEMSEGISARGFAVEAYPWLARSAAILDESIKQTLRLGVFFLVLAVAISAYTAWGKSLMDTLDAVRRDDSATQRDKSPKPAEKVAYQGDDPARPGPRDPNQQPEKTEVSAGAQGAPGGNLPDCQPEKDVDYQTTDICHRLNDIVARRESISIDLEKWLNATKFWAWSWNDGPPAPKEFRSSEKPIWPAEKHRKEIEQQSVAMMTVIGNYLMPVLYGFLGSGAFVLRRYHRRLSLFLLSPYDRRANVIRLLLGTLIGGCIGLVYSGSGQAQATGTVGLVVTLSTSGLAFLAGYGVEGVFKALDSLIAQVFRVNGTENAPEQAPQK